jgi:hypothetical protein
MIKHEDLKEKKWWMSFPEIESRIIKPEPYGPPPNYKVGDKIKLHQRPERIRKVLEIQWHMHRYQWVYIVETSASDSGSCFKPYWFEDKLELVEIC